MSTNEPDGPPTDPWQPPPPPPPPPPPYAPAPPPPPPGAPTYTGPTYGEPPAYGQAPAYGYQAYAAPTTEGSATGALVASILSFVVCPVVPAIVALAMIPSARRKIQSSGGRLTGESLLTAAKWISIIHLALVALAVVAILAIIVLGASTSTTTTSDFSFATALAR